MKRAKFLIASLVVVIAMASCATTQSTANDDFDNAITRRVGNRVYVDDPYYGTVILERDPVTGRYYDVTYGNRPYGYYNYPYGGLNTRVYRSYNARPNGYYNHNVQRVPQPTGVTRGEARRRVLGN